MEVEVLGIGNAFTSVYNNTSFLIRGEGVTLIDAPQGLFRILRERGVTPDQVEGVIVTHVHGDHVAGLETLILWKHYIQGCRTRIYTSEQVFEQLSTVFFASFAETFNSSMDRIIKLRFEDYVDFIELSEDSPTVISESLSVEIRHNWHPVPTLGLKLCTSEFVLGISGDTCYRPSLLQRLYQSGTIDANQYGKLTGEWLWNADLVYHEADRVDGGPHTHERDLLMLPHEIQQKIRIVHVPDDFPEETLPIAREGERVKLTGSVGLREVVR